MSGNGWTLSRLLQARMNVRAYCEARGCGHNRQVDLAALMDRIGPDAPAMAPDIAPRFKCAICGSRNVKLIYSPDVRPTGWR